MQRRSFLQLALAGSSMAAAEKAVNALTSSSSRVEPHVQTKTANVFDVVTHLVRVPDDHLLWDLGASSSPRILVAIDGGKSHCIDGKFRQMQQRFIHLELPLSAYADRPFDRLMTWLFHGRRNCQETGRKLDALIGRLDRSLRLPPVHPEATPEKQAFWVVEDHVIRLTCMHRDLDSCPDYGYEDQWRLAADIWCFFNVERCCMDLIGIEKEAKVSLMKASPSSQL